MTFAKSQQKAVYEVLYKHSTSDNAFASAMLWSPREALAIKLTIPDRNITRLFILAGKCPNIFVVCFMWKVFTCTRA